MDKEFEDLRNSSTNDENSSEQKDILNKQVVSLVLRITSNGITPEEIKQGIAKQNKELEADLIESNRKRLLSSETLTPTSPGLRTSKTYSHILNDPIMNRMVEEYEALSPEEKRIHNLIIDKKIRNNYRKKTSRLKPISLQLASSSKNIKSFEFQAYLEDVTKELERQGLWKEELFEDLESDVCTINDTRDDDVNENFEPKELHLIYNSKNIRILKDPLAELTEEGLEWQDRLSISMSEVPEFTTPTVHNLIRRSPWELYEVIARKLVEGTFLAKHPEFEHLFPCAYFVSKSIFERYLFIQVKYEAFTGTPLQKLFRTYSFKRYQKDRKTLKKLTDKLLEKYFNNNLALKKNINSQTLGRESEKKLKSIWQRFLKAHKALTRKQKEALELIYMQDSPLTYAEAAKSLGISKDSFQDRIRGAVKKLKDAVPELLELLTTEPSSEKTSNAVYSNGFFDKAAAKRILPVYKINPLKGESTDLPIRDGAPMLRAEATNKTIVRAWAINLTPVPDILFTDYFLGLIPEAQIYRNSGQSKFKG